MNYLSVQLPIIIALFLLAAGTAACIISRRQIEIRIGAKAGVQARKGAGCTISVRNRSILPVSSLRMICSVNNRYTGQTGRHKVTAAIQPKGEAEVDISVDPGMCGKINVSVEKAWLTDLFGIIRIPVKAGASCNFTVLPELFDTELAYNPHESDIFDCDDYSPYRKGRDYTEIFQVREYVDGDSVKNIHWKLSSKSEELIVKDGSYPLDKRIMIVADKTARGSVRPQDAEALAEIVLSTGERLMAEEMAFELVWNDVDEAVCHSKHIQFYEELASAMPEILSSPVKEGRSSCGELYSQIYGEPGVTHILYVSCGESESDICGMSAGSIININACADDYRERCKEINLY